MPGGVQITKTQWSNAAENILYSAAFGEIADIKDQVISGESELWHVSKAKTFGGYVVTRVEKRPDSTTLVIVAGAGQYGRDAMSLFCAIADKNAWSMRVHSTRRGMGRYLTHFGFQSAETIYKRGLQHG